MVGRSESKERSPQRNAPNAALWRIKMLYSVLCHLRPRKQAAAAGFWTTRRQWLRALEMGSDCRHTQVEHSTTRLAQLEVLSWKFSHTCIPARFRRSSALPFCLNGVSSALAILAAGKEKKCHGRQCQVRSVVGELDEGPTSKQQVKSGETSSLG